MATPRSHKRERQSEPTTLMSLGDDILAEILRRLPSLPSLARAAFACSRLRDLASDVANRIISPAPLLGYFASFVGGVVPSFHRAHLLSDRGVAGIVRRGDFYLADFEDYDWRLMDCRKGLLLLTSDRCIAVFDPVSSSRLRIPHYTSDVGGESSFRCFLPSRGGATSFRMLCLESTGGGRVRPHVYSSCTGEWCSHLLLAPKGIKAPRRGDPHSNHYLPMHAGGRIYWRTNAEKLTSLHVSSMEFSHVGLPGEVHHSYALGDTEDGTTCIVSVSTKYQHKLDIRVWFLKEEDGLSWERQWRVDASELDLSAGPVTPSKMLKVYDVTAGIVLLSMGYKNNGIRYLAFRLKDTLWEGTTNTKTKTNTNTRRQSLILADFCTSSGWVQPCFMTWPRPSLKWGTGDEACRYNERASSAHAREDSLRIPAAERSMPVSSAPAMICIDGRFDGSGSMQRLTTLQITARSSVLDVAQLRVDKLPDLLRLAGGT
ncbi:hypothetical protein ACQ4PT_017184 [Festuca glaucescens]